MIGIWKISQNSFPPKERVLRNSEKILSNEPKNLDNVTSWQKALNDASISRDEVRQAHIFATSKTLLPQFHDKKFRLLCRKTQFNNSLNKHNTSVSAYCDWCKNVMNVEVKESLVHAL